jgi:hypothetical protein
LFSASVKEARMRPSKTSSRGLNGKRQPQPAERKIQRPRDRGHRRRTVGIVSIIVTNAYAVTNEA